MSQVHPLEENDVKGEKNYQYSNHIDYLYEIAAVVEEHGTEEDKKEMVREFKKNGIFPHVSGVEMIRRIVARAHEWSDDDEYDPDRLNEYARVETMRDYQVGY